MGDVATPYEKDYLRLQAENERLRAALEQVLGVVESLDFNGVPGVVVFAEQRTALDQRKAET